MKAVRAARKLGQIPAFLGRRAIAATAKRRSPAGSARERSKVAARDRMRRLGSEWGPMSRVLIGLLAAVACLGLAGTAMADGITNAGGDLRTGWYPDEGSLTPQLVSGNAFGRLWSAPVDGQVYAQPLYTPSSAPNGTVVVATENDKVYGLDPATGQQQWMTDLGTPWNPADLDPDCKDIAPSVGTSSTPVIDT